MPFQIRNKETKEILKVRSGKTIWATAGHAKAAFATSGLGWRGDYEKVGLKPFCKFSEQDVFEIIEVTYNKDLPRFCFVTDGEGHNFLIPTELSLDFYGDLEVGEEDAYAEFSNKYGQYAIDSMTNWTFTDPREDA